MDTGWLSKGISVIKEYTMLLRAMFDQMMKGNGIENKKFFMTVIFLSLIKIFVCM